MPDAATVLHAHVHERPTGQGRPDPRPARDPRPVRAVLFDADGVLQKPRAHWTVSLSAKGWAASDIRDFIDAVDSTLDGHARLYPLADAFVAARGLPLTHDENVALWLDATVDADALALVGEVRGRGVRTILATNQSHERAEWMQASLGYEAHLDEQFYSNELGLAKPDPAFFTAICDAIGLDPADALFIDDRDENVAAARTVGLRAELHPWDADAHHLRAILARHGVL